jgi:hypothetical protein
VLPASKSGDLLENPVEEEVGDTDEVDSGTEIKKKTCFSIKF